MTSRMIAIIVVLVLVNQSLVLGQETSEIKTLKDLQWYMEDFYSVYDQLYGYDNEVTIAVIDSGFNFYHEDLQEIALDGYNFRENNEWVMDIHGHGTSLIGMIAANSSDSIGIDGLIGNLPVQILPIRISAHGDDALSSDVVRGLRYAIDQHVDVINLSFISYMYSQVEDDLIQEAISKGIAVIASVGNHGQEAELYPAAYDGVIGVGSIDINSRKSDFSNFGKTVDVVAPGEDLYLPMTGNTYEICEGTSYSTAYVSAVVSIIKVMNPTIKVDDIEALLKETAIDLGLKGEDSYYGAGQVNIIGIVDAMIGRSLPKVKGIESAQLNENCYILEVGESMALPQMSVLPKGTTGKGLFFSGSVVEKNQIVSYESGRYEISVVDSSGTVFDRALVWVLDSSKAELTTYNEKTYSNFKYAVEELDKSINSIRENSFLINQEGELLDISFRISSNGDSVIITPVERLTYGMGYTMVVSKGEGVSEVVHKFYVENEDPWSLNARIHSFGDDYVSVDWNDNSVLEGYHIYYSDGYENDFYPFLNEHGYKAIFPKIELYGVKNINMIPGQKRYYFIEPVINISNPYTTITSDISDIIAQRTKSNDHIEQLKGLIPDEITWINENLIDVVWIEFDASTTTISCNGIACVEGRPVEYNITYEVDFEGKTTQDKEKNLILTKKIMVNGIEE